MTGAKDRAVMLLSGGLDSGVLLANTLRSANEIRCLSVDYGSKHSAQELRAARILSKKFGVEHTVLECSFLNELFRSSLLSDGPAIPDGTYDEQNMRSTVVPFRNGIFLAIAVGLAEDLGFGTVLIGSHAGDSAVYPDCRAPFSEAFSRAARLGTYHEVEIQAPFAHLTKREIVELGRDIDFDFALTWTCYKGGKLHCGTCAACNARKTALDFVEGKDPTRYESA